MKWTKPLALAAALLTAVPAAASDLSDAAKAVLPPMFSFREIPGVQQLYFGGHTIPYEAAQLTADMKRDGVFLSGYIFYASVPAEGALSPYFRYNLTRPEWEGLAAVNKAFFDENASLHQAVAESVRRWADQMVGGEGAHLDVRLSELEPVRRSDGAGCILYTAGARITLDSEGLILPLYGRGYLYKDGGVYRLILLITGDDSRQPMAYALEDMAKEAAARAARRDVAAFVESIKNNPRA